jgi:hypothetical protein
VTQFVISLCRTSILHQQVLVKRNWLLEFTDIESVKGNFGTFSSTPFLVPFFIITGDCSRLMKNTTEAEVVY